MTTYTAPKILAACSLVMFATAMTAPSHGAFVAAWILGVIVGGLAGVTTLGVAATRRRVAATLGRLPARSVDRLADR